MSFDPKTKKSRDVHHIVAKVHDDDEVLSNLFWGKSELDAGLIIHSDNDVICFEAVIKPSILNANQSQSAAKKRDFSVAKASKALRQIKRS
tara:strand:+ start:3043 stop:3315 length:273 start_codon:yes stop_codon:yes gene_type:complete